MCRSLASITVSLILLLSVSGRIAVAQQPLDADAMRAALRTAAPEEDGFVDDVVGLVEAGRLPRGLVEGTFQWARRKSRHRFQYFRAALIVRAARIGIRL